jgi:hypothetical protein
LRKNKPSKLVESGVVLSKCLPITTETTNIMDRTGKQTKKASGRNGLCKCGSGKKTKKCCFSADKIEDAPIDEPHVRFSYHCLNNIWERFPDSKSTPEYWQTKEELNAFNDLLTIWMGIPATHLKQHGVREDAYNAIAQIQQQDAVTRLVNATKTRAHIDPSIAGGYFRSLGEMARIFHGFRMTLLLDDVFENSSETKERVEHDIMQCINAFRNMLLVGVYNTTLDDFVQENPGYEEESTTTILKSGDIRRYILIDIAKKRVHEVPVVDPNHDVLFWKRRTRLHYSRAFLGDLARFIESEAKPIFPTEWLCDRKVQAMLQVDGGSSEELITPFGACTDDTKCTPMPSLAKGSRLTDLLGSDSDRDDDAIAAEHGAIVPKKDWVYIGRDGKNLMYHPIPTFKWTLKEDREKIVGYFHYLSAVFCSGNSVVLSPLEWLQKQHTN